MNKFLTKKSLFTTSVIVCAIMILSFAFNMIFGVNHSVRTDDHQTVTISINDYHYNNDLEDIQDVCETVFEANNLKYEYVYNSSMSADGELVYVFKASDNLGTVKQALEAAFKTATAVDGSVDGAEIFVQPASETVVVKLLGNYAWRTVLAIAVFAVLAFVYVSLRYRLHMGFVVAGSTVCGAVLSAALILLVRIPVTTMILNVIAVSAMLSTVFTMLTLNKYRANMKSEEFTNKTAEEAVLESFAGKEILAIVAVLGVALVLVGAISRLNVFYFALMGLLGLIGAVVVGAIIATAALVPVLENVKKAAAEKSKSGYVGAKKASDEQDA